MSFKKYNAFGYRDKLALVLDRLDAAKTAIENMPSGGDPIAYSIDENGVISKGIVDFKLPGNAKDASDYAFSLFAQDIIGAELRGNIKTTSLSPLENISGAYAFSSTFSDCKGLESADLSTLKEVTGRYTMSDMFSNSSIETVDVSSLEKVTGESAMSQCFSQCVNLESISFDSLKEVGNKSMQRICSGCTALKSVALPSLEKIGDYGISEMFRNCTALESMSFPNVETISGYSFLYAFQGCSSLKTVSLPKVETALGYSFSYAFQDCTSLESVEFTSLKNIDVSTAMNRTFSRCSSLKDVRFPVLGTEGSSVISSALRYLLSDVNGCTLHFAASAESRIRTMTGYPNFSGTNTVVLFDL